MMLRARPEKVQREAKERFSSEAFPALSRRELRGQQQRQATHRPQPSAVANRKSAWDHWLTFYLPRADDATRVSCKLFPFRLPSPIPLSHAPMHESSFNRVGIAPRLPYDRGPMGTRLT